ncbi:MobP3 family relaxase [Acutalibacter muris]|uniref:MobP3 family relaxase n=1 Tax=Acutalibacter muris TaxID=1796620 RepID=UPI0026F3DA95|nr:MobP3 family relaxase [Acutalibacter muris]
MAKLVTKFKFLKPSARQGRGGYAKYIATRDGVEKIDDTKRFAPVSWNQKKLIVKILRDFPDSKEMLEYEDYRQKQTIESASEFISRAIEDNAAVALNAKTYADYIATRPRAERFGSHGLFTDDGVQVNLAEVSRELNEYGGNVWTAIISLRREDAERLGFDNGSRWRDMLRTQTQALSENLRIPMGHLKWFAAFHNESHHPHVHLIAYSTVESEGYLTKQGVQKLRSAFAKDIFAQDLLCIYEKQTEHRNQLRSESKDVLAEIVAQINAGGYFNQHLEELLVQLARWLSRTKGKKVYGYLKADVKALIDSIVDEIAKDNRISALYDLWYGQRENVLRTYNSSLPERVPLSQNKEFKMIKNAITQAAMDLVLDSQQEQGEAEDDTDNKHKPLSTVGTANIGMNALRLLQQTSQILQNEVRPVYQDKRVDRKLRRKINEKKQAQGLRHG